jgi:PiT family inorganic phosphate transporter
VRWGVAGNIALAWVLTLPAAGAVGALVYAVTRVFGHGAAGPVIVTLACVALIAMLFLRRAQLGEPATAVSD